MNRFMYGTTSTVLAIFIALSAHAAQTGSDNRVKTRHKPPVEKDHPAPTDYGPGPGVRPRVQPDTASATVLSGSPGAETKGTFGEAVTWPLIPIHAILLPNGRVLTYGTDGNGAQGGQLIYDVWDPTMGTGPNTHTVLPNMTGTDIFCSAQTVLSAGKVLITGGDNHPVYEGEANHDTEIFDPQQNTLTTNANMSFDRWYPTALNLPNGEVAILGGMWGTSTDNAVITPEVFSSTGQPVRQLTGAASDLAFGKTDWEWYYPRSFVMPSGNVFVVGYDGSTYSLSTVAGGSITQLNAAALPGEWSFPSVMYGSGKVLSLRYDNKVNLIDLNTTPPTVATTADVDQARYWASAAVLADGKVLVTGGSAGYNTLEGVAYNALIWDPSSGTWTVGAAAAKARLYHSNSLLLPDATVLTAGGGAPGPVNNLNAEIYYPPYLFASGGTPATRPTITKAPALMRLGQKPQVTVGTGVNISKVTLVRTGSVTHSFDPSQRYLPVLFTQNGNKLTITMPSNSNVALPGYYMLFVFQNDVPSIAKIVQVM